MFDRIQKGLYWDRIWRLTAGCEHVSAGCDNCWSERESHRRCSVVPYQYGGVTIGGHNAFTGKWSKVIRALDKNLGLPLKTKKPQAWLVLNDLFHEKVPDDFILNALEIMEMSKRHIFFILTKRPQIMKDYFVERTQNPLKTNIDTSNIYLGVSVEDQQTADDRIPLLLQTPAERRFISYEPAIAPVNLLSIPRITAFHCQPHGFTKWFGKMINWVVVGGETGPAAQPVHPDWVRSVRDQCQAAGVPIFIKQLHINSKASRNMDEWPDDLKIKGLPSVE